MTNIKVSEAEKIEIIRTDEPVEDGAVLFRLIFDRPSLLKMHAHLTFNVGFRPIDLNLSPQLGFLPFTDVMNKIHHETAQVIRQLTPFF